VIQAVTGFVELLRRAGLRISTPELTDAAQAVAAVGLDDPAAVRAALAATLIKRAGDVPLFDEMYELYFRRHPIELDVRDAAEEAGLAAIRSPLQVGMMTYRILDGMGSLGGGGEADQLRNAVRAYVGDELHRRDPALDRRLALATLADRPISQLSPQEQAALDTEVQRLARRLATRIPLPRPSHHRGRLDVRATMRRSFATGGVPFDVRRRRRPVRRPRLFLLCDISDSVRLVSRFLLAIVHALTRRYDRVHTFVFVADLGDATALFKSRDAGRAIAEVLAGAVVDPWQSSDYGRTFAALAERHLGKIGSRTTVIILGDGRSNHRPPRADLLAAVGRRAHRVLWLNPEPTASWGWGDSAMRAYEPHCERAMTVWNLASLRSAINELWRS
jgi:uncharacterized protein with von Willebrand factor type A (vWA) domain